MAALPDGLAAVIEEDHSALNDFMRGNPGAEEADLFARRRRDLGEPDGSARSGMGRSCRDDSMKRPPPCGTPRHFRSNGSARVVTAGIAYTVEIEHYQGQQFAGSDEPHDFDLRVTMIFRREPVGWHRPAARRRDHDGATG
jgi:hypothetical protein